MYFSEYGVEENIVDVIEKDIDVILHKIIIIDHILFPDGYNIETLFQIHTIVFELRTIFAYNIEY